MVWSRKRATRFSSFQGPRDKSAVHTPQLILHRATLFSLPSCQTSHAQLKRTSDFIALLTRMGASAANGAAISNVRLFIPEFLQIARNRKTCSYRSTLKLGESSMHHTHGSSSFANAEATL